MPKMTKPDIIRNPIAEDTWSFVNPDGTTGTAKIVVGRPYRRPDGVHGDWLCPIKIEHYTGGIQAFAGLGAVDALMNAMGVVKGFAEHIGELARHAKTKPEGNRPRRRSRNIKIQRRVKRTRKA